MRLRMAMAVLVGVVVFAAGAQAQYGNAPGIAPAQAQDAKPAQAKGVKTRGLVGSTGPIAAVPMTIPMAVSGQVIELEPGGQTGRQRNLVPTLLYVLEGTVTINTEGGPVGVSGVQYHGESQSYAGPANLWYNAMNTTQQPVRYLLLFFGPPGGKTLEQSAE